MSVTRTELVDAARRHLQPGISHEQALVLGYAELDGTPLDAWSFDGAAELLRAERLLQDGLTLPLALTTARAERIHFSVPTDEQTT